MKERPILMSAPMVRAILEGRKTQTRRVAKPQPDSFYTRDSTGRLDNDGDWVWFRGNYPQVGRKNKYGVIGDGLWVRETWRVFGVREYEYQHHQPSVIYRSDSDAFEQEEWRPSIFMPRWASRITLEVTSVRVERLMDITANGAKAEGVTPHDPIPFPDNAELDRIEEDCRWRGAYEVLWDKINGKTYPWASNPWVWVIEFKRL